MFFSLTPLSKNEKEKLSTIDTAFVPLCKNLVDTRVDWKSGS